MSSKYVPFMTSGSLHSKKSNTSSTVELLHEIDIAEVLKRDNVNQDLWTKSQTSSTSSSYRNLCLLDVPAHMIPKEILRFFGSSLSLISSIRIVKHSSESDRYLALLDVASPAATHTLISEFSGQMLSSLENVRCLLLLVANVSFDSEDESCSKEIDVRTSFATHLVVVYLSLICHNLL